MADDVKALIRASQQAKAVYQSIAAATSLAEVNLHVSDITKARGELSAAVDIVRNDLGLPRASP